MYQIRGTEYTEEQMFELLKILPELEVCAVDNRLDYAYDMLIDVTAVRDKLIPLLTDNQLDIYYYHMDCGKSLAETGIILGKGGANPRKVIQSTVGWIKKKLVKVLEAMQDDVG